MKAQSFAQKNVYSTRIIYESSKGLHRKFRKCFQSSYYSLGAYALTRKFSLDRIEWMIRDTK